MCALRGHALVGRDAEEFRDEDRVFARQMANGRWHRCLRCDGWFAVPAPAEFAHRHPPDRDDIELPLRGRALRSKIILRLIAVDRALHFLILSGVSVVLFEVAANQRELEGDLIRIISDFHGGSAALIGGGDGGLVGGIQRFLEKPPDTLRLYGLGAAALGVLEGVEAVGLWMQRRWAEYLTLVATAAFIPLEIYELVHRTTALKIFALVVNLAIVVYLLFAKRLFGLRGGEAALEAERLADSGWAHLEATSPQAEPAPRG